MKKLNHVAILVILCSIFPTFVQAQTNVNLGTNAGNAGTGNVSIGYGAGDIVTNNDNVFVGYVAGGVTTTGTVNAFVGAYSGRYNTTGNRNSFYGYFSGPANTTGTYNTFIGTYSGYTLTTGNNNTFLGTSTGYTNTNGSGNVFLGYNAGYNETGSDKLYIDNSNTSTPLIYGDFASNRVGINALPGSYTLNVGGTLNATGIAVNGTTIVTTSGSNISFNSGIVSIGTTTAPAGYKLAVGGKMVAEEVVIKLQANWPDYVFAPGYSLPSLSELEKFIINHRHLPEIPSAEEVKENGVTVGEINALLLKKVEELTLYMIEANKKIEGLQKEVEQLKARH